jgi:hypothetical protein
MEMKRMSQKWGWMLAVCMIFATGCGHSVQVISDEEASRSVSEKTALREQVARLQTEIKRVTEEKEKEITHFGTKENALEARLDESMTQLRLIQSSLERDEKQAADVGRKTSALVVEQAKQSKSTRSELQLQMDRLGKAEEATNKMVVSLSEQVASLSASVPPTLTAQAAQIANLEKQLQKGGKGDSAQIKKRLDDLSNMLDLLGQTITVKVDEQDQVLSKILKRLKGLESQRPNASEEIQ